MPKLTASARAPVVEAKELRSFLDELDVSQEEFGAAFGVGTPTVARWVAPGGVAPGWVGTVMRLIQKAFTPEIRGEAVRKILEMEKRSPRGRR